MTRYRPPRKPESPYITAEGAIALRSELARIWRIERPKIAEAVHEAAKNGDRSENGDYIYGKRRLAEIDHRVRYLTKRLQCIKVVDTAPSDPGRVYFGAWVTVSDKGGTETTYRIVGSNEIDLSRGYISVDSPMAGALVGKKSGEEVRFTHAGKTHLSLIVSISYHCQN
jgi:transcription elongation factor GreB